MANTQKHHLVRMVTNEGLYHKHTGWIVNGLPTQGVSGNELLEREIQFAKQQLGELLECSEFAGYELHIVEIWAR